MPEDEIYLLQKDLKPNLLVSIVVKDSGNRGLYHSRIEEVGDSHLMLAAPIKQGALVALSEGANIEVQIASRDLNCSFSSKVLRRVRHPIPMLLVELPAKAIRLQRRAWVRVPTVMNLSYLLLTEDDSEPAPVEAKTIDISGGGMLFATREDIKPESFLVLKFSLFPGEEMEMLGRVVRVSKQIEERMRPIRVAVEFQGVDNRERGQITRYVFERQRELIRRGVL